MTSTTTTLTDAQCVDALAAYLKATITNDALGAVAAQDPDTYMAAEIGWEVVETYEHEHEPLLYPGDDDDSEVLTQLLNLGRAAIITARELVR